MPPRWSPPGGHHRQHPAGQNGRPSRPAGPGANLPRRHFSATNGPANIGRSNTARTGYYSDPGAPNPHQQQYHPQQGQYHHQQYRGGHPAGYGDPVGPPPASSHPHGHMGSFVTAGTTYYNGPPAFDHPHQHPYRCPPMEHGPPRFGGHPAGYCGLVDPHFPHVHPPGHPDLYPPPPMAAPSPAVGPYPTAGHHGSSYGGYGGHAPVAAGGHPADRPDLLPPPPAAGPSPAVGSLPAAAPHPAAGHHGSTYGGFGGHAPVAAGGNPGMDTHGQSAGGGVGSGPPAGPSAGSGSGHAHHRQDGVMSDACGKRKKKNRPSRRARQRKKRQSVSMFPYYCDLHSI